MIDEEPERPYAFIQYKGTDLCADINCECGALCHIDADSVYTVQCVHCGKVWDLGCYVPLKPSDEKEDLHVKLVVDENFPGEPAMPVLPRFRDWYARLHK